MEHKMKYSIIMPIYMGHPNHLSVVEEALKSIQANSSDHEVIIVDDGSPFPATVEMVKEFSDQLLRREENKGIAPSWNEGIQAAKGEYIVIVNDDIVVQNKNWLDKMRQALEMEDEYMVSAPGVEGGQNGTGIEEDYQWFPGYCFMLKRETIDKIGLFDEQFVPFNWEDWDYWTRVLKSGGKLVRNYNTTIKHIGGSVLHTLDYDMIDSINKQKYLKKWGIDPTNAFCYNQPFDFTKL